MCYTINKMDKQTQYELLGEAIRMAEKNHRGLNDLEGEPIIFHLFRVADRCKGDIDAQIVAILHDIVEDTQISITDIRNKFPEEISKAVSLLTHRKDKTYEVYIEDLLTNDLARKVKKADLEDNLDIYRLVFIRKGLNKLAAKGVKVNTVNWIFDHVKSYERIIEYEEGVKKENESRVQAKSS